MLYLRSKRYDLIWIIGPAFFSSIFVILFHLSGSAPKVTSPLYWMIFVVFIDVAHVWSTLFRTYLHREKKQQFQKILWLAPIICYGVGVILHSFGEMVFWRCLAYLAVFHFIRQQFGIFQLYSFKATSEEIKRNNKWKWIDQLAIYSATVIPMIIWHLNGIQEIHWFMAGDFWYLNNPNASVVFMLLGLIIFLLYICKEIFVAKNNIFCPKTLFLLGTYLAWWVGIVWIKTDWAFTITNVVSHGIPYFALIYMQDIKNREKIYWPRYLPTVTIFLFLLVLGYTEEGLWDVFIWNEHKSLFPFFKGDIGIDNYQLLALIVPLLTLPQATHYVLDGYIWKRPE